MIYLLFKLCFVFLLMACILLAVMLKNAVAGSAIFHITSCCIDIIR